MIGAAAGLAGSVALSQGDPSGAGQAQAGGPMLAVEPSAVLVDGQTVRVRGSGFAARQAIDVLHCAAGSSADHLSCDVEATVTTVSDDQGSFELDVEIFGLIPRGDGETVDCRAPDGCAPAATAGLRGPDEPGVAPLAFDPDTALMPPPSLTLTPDADLVAGLSVFQPVPGGPPSLVFHSTADTVLPFNNAPVGWVGDGPRGDLAGQVAERLWVGLRRPGAAQRLELGAVHLGEEEPARVPAAM